MDKVYIIGIGPGTDDYLTPMARKFIEKADCLVGAKRILSLFRHLRKETFALEGHFEEAIPYIQENRGTKRVAVLVSGDPGLYSFLGPISKVLKKEEYEVIPGISALQAAFARIGESWHDARVLSLHGRSIEDLLGFAAACDKLFLFTDSKFPPQKIASYLLDNGIENRRAVVFEELGMENEKVTDTDLKNLSAMNGFALCVMIVKR